jgi:hypothetical protein
MVKISKFGEDFLLLALRINKHINGYIDFYFGPEKLKQLVENESLKSPNILLKDSLDLIHKLGAQGFKKERNRYLKKMLTAMKTSVETLKGKEISISDQFLLLYDVKLKPAKESELTNLKEECDDAYRGSGSLEARFNNLRTQRMVSKANVFNFFQKALKIVKMRTNEFFFNFLPKEEKIRIELANNNKSKENLKWNCYNWYLGDFTSRIVVNPYYGMYWTAFLMFATHEGYPGHHTEFVLKEQKLYRELNQFEHSLLILHSPKLLISEGIGNLAISTLYSDQEAAEIGLREFCPNKVQAESIEQLTFQNKVRKKISLFWYNLAYRALIDKYNTEELIRYGKNFEVFDEDTIQNNIKRLSDPVYSKNAFLYELGTNLIRKKYGDIPSIKNFKNLLENAILPSDLE